jgi:hypothetical protein
VTSNGHLSGKPLRAGDPRELDGYRILGRLGRGGMGTVYLAKDAADRTVAVKLIHPDLADDESFRRRFAREVASARRVARFSTAAVIDARLEGDPLFIVSEYVPGPNLDEAIRADGTMAGGTLEGLAMGVAAALTAIHGSGVIHRDLKPANVLLSPVGPKVIDFGIARALDDAEGSVTRSSQLMGTPSYMAPELILGEQPTHAADIFAWGCLVAFAGTGSAPFDAATVPAVLHNISSAPPRLDGLDPSLYDLVASALDKNPENRPSSQQILARLVGQEDPEESEVRRTITSSWAPPSSTPVPGAPPTTGEPVRGAEEPTESAAGGAGAHDGRAPGATPSGGQQASGGQAASGGQEVPGARTPTGGQDTPGGRAPSGGPEIPGVRTPPGGQEFPGHRPPSGAQAPGGPEGPGGRTPTGGQETPGLPPEGQETRIQQPYEEPTRIQPARERFGAADPALTRTRYTPHAQWPSQDRPPSGPQQPPGPGGHPPPVPGHPGAYGQPGHQGPQGQPGQPGHYGASGGQAGLAPTQRIHGQQSPPYGQAAFGAYPGGPGGPGQPGGPERPDGPGAGETPPTGGGARRRLLVIGAAAGAVVLAATAGTAFWINRGTPLPETTSVYGTDFSSDPGWNAGTYEPGESDGYWAEQRGFLHTLDPENSPSRDTIVPLEREQPLPESVLVSTAAYVVEGPAQAMFGVRCWDNEGEEHRSQYEALLRFDGERAEIRRMHEGEGDRTLGQADEVSGYEPYPLFDESARDDADGGGGSVGDPYDFDSESVPTNTVSLACTLREDREGAPVMELTMWVNGEHALTTMDDEPLPDDAEDPEDRRTVGIVARPGPGNDPLGVLHTEFSVDEITTEE